MTIRPNQVIHAYLSGNRVRYIGPLGYVVIMTALLIISFDLYGLEVEDFLKENSKTFNPMMGADQPSAEQSAMQEKLMRFMAQNFRFVATMMIPFYALTFGWFFRKEKLNYVERLVVSTYSFCHSMWITMVGLGVFALTGHLYTGGITILSVCYLAFVAHRTFPRRNFFFGFLRVLGSYFLAIIVFIGLMLVVGIVAGIVMVISNR